MSPKTLKTIATLGAVLATAAVVPASAAASTDLRSPDARDAAERRAPVIVRVDGSPDTGVDWQAVGLGALVSAGLLISIAGAYVLIGRRRGHGPHVA